MLPPSTLRTLVQLVSDGCNRGCVELLMDFDASGGYCLLVHDISRSLAPRVNKMLELARDRPGLAPDRGRGDPVGRFPAHEGGGEVQMMLETVVLTKMAMDTNAFEVMNDERPCDEVYRRPGGVQDEAQGETSGLRPRVGMWGGGRLQRAARVGRASARVRKGRPGRHSCQEGDNRL